MSDLPSADRLRDIEDDPESVTQAETVCMASELLASRALTAALASPQTPTPASAERYHSLARPHEPSESVAAVNVRIGALASQNPPDLIDKVGSVLQASVNDAEPKGRWVSDKEWVADPVAEAEPVFISRAFDPHTASMFAPAASVAEAEPDSRQRRRTFVIPEGHEAVRDADGRATGEVRLIDPVAEAERDGLGPVAWRYYSSSGQLFLSHSEPAGGGIGYEPLYSRERIEADAAKLAEVEKSRATVARIKGAALTAAGAEIARLTAALEPFAKRVPTDVLDNPAWPDDTLTTHPSQTLGDFRAARAALEPKP